MPALPRSTMTHLECSRCGKTHAHNRLQNLCTCGKPLLARYELKAAAKTLTREALTTRPANMWRYAEVLPGGPPGSLGEGVTPLLDARKVGADVRKIDGLISDCGKYVAEHKDREGWFDVSTLKEPYRIEGKKTMGYELWEQFGGKLPDVIIYPTGGGVGLIGMCKAFDEMEAMGWVASTRPRMVSVQAAGCAPIVEAYERGSESSEFWDHAATIASGLRVPKALGDFLILRMIRTSRGTAVTATDEEMLAAGRELAAFEGIYAAPEGAATLVAARKLVAAEWINPEETVVLFNTGSGYKYSEAWERALNLSGIQATVGRQEQ